MPISESKQENSDASNQSNVSFFSSLLPESHPKKAKTGNGGPLSRLLSIVKRILDKYVVQEPEATIFITNTNQLYTTTFWAIFPIQTFSSS
jgi:hypothetical protein